MFKNTEYNNTPLDYNPIAVTANATYETPKGATLSSVGTYYWVASYSGDHNNSAAESGCAAEPVDVTPAGPAKIGRAAGREGVVGGVVKVEVKVSGLSVTGPGVS